MITKCAEKRLKELTAHNRKKLQEKMCQQITDPCNPMSQIINNSSELMAKVLKFGKEHNYRDLTQSAPGSPIITGSSNAAAAAAAAAVYDLDPGKLLSKMMELGNKKKNQQPTFRITKPGDGVEGDDDEGVVVVVGGRGRTLTMMSMGKRYQALNTDDDEATGAEARETRDDPIGSESPTLMNEYTRIIVDPSDEEDTSMFLLSPESGEGVVAKADDTCLGRQRPSEMLDDLRRVSETNVSDGIATYSNRPSSPPGQSEVHVASSTSGQMLTGSLDVFSTYVTNEGRRVASEEVGGRSVARRDVGQNIDERCMPNVHENAACEERSEKHLLTSSTFNLWPGVDLGCAINIRIYINL